MPRFAANLSLLFSEKPFLDRFGAAQRAGFSAVEFMFPYEFAAVDIARELAAHRLDLVLFNMPPGDWQAGERGLACLPGREPEFREAVALARTYARQLNCPRLHCMAGIVPEVPNHDLLHTTYVANLRFAADELAGDGVTLMIEPINTRDMPGYFLSGTQQALAVMSEVARPNVKLQYDCYHMHIMEGAIAQTIASNLDVIGHIQVADAPGRHEPGTGEIDFHTLFAHIDAMGYRGHVGCEYRPASTTEPGLAWLRSFEQQQLRT